MCVLITREGDGCKLWFARLLSPGAMLYTDWELLIFNQGRVGDCFDSANFVNIIQLNSWKLQMINSSCRVTLVEILEL